MIVMKDFKRVLMNTFNEIKAYQSDYLYLWLFIQFILLVVGIPTIFWFVQQAFQSSGINGLTHQNMGSLFTNPLGIIFLVLSVMITVFVVMIEVTLYLAMQKNHALGQAFGFKDWWQSFSQFKGKMIGFQSLIIFFYIIVFIPILGINILTSVTRDLYLPYFISGELLKSTTGTILYWSVILIGTYLNIRLIFTVYYIYHQPSISVFQAMKKSFKQTKHKTIRMIFNAAIAFVVLSVGLVGLQMILLVPVYLADEFLRILAPFIAALMLTIFAVVLFIVWGVSKVWLAQFLLYYITNEHVKSHINHQTITNKVKLILIMLVGITLVSNTVLMTQAVYGIRTKLVAHRGGDLTYAVENTIQSLTNAQASKPDYIEMDVFETKDHQFVVFHDTTLRRMTGDSRGIHELTLSELEAMPMSQNGMIDYMPSFETFLKEAKKLDQKLLIEIKSHGHESSDMIEHFIALIETYDEKHQHLIQSFKLEELDQIKRINPDIQVGYVIPINIGRLNPVPVDFITLEEFSFDATIQQDAFNQGIDIFLWTINDPVLLRRYMFKGVDAIITGNIVVARSIYESLEQDATLTNRLKWLFTDWLK